MTHLLRPRTDLCRGRAALSSGRSAPLAWRGMLHIGGQGITQLSCMLGIEIYGIFLALKRKNNCLAGLGAVDIINKNDLNTLRH